MRSKDSDGKPLEWLFFIDADIHFDPRDAAALLALAGQPDKNGDPRLILSAPYTKKTIAWEQVYAATQLGVVDDAEEGPEILKRFTGDFVFNPSVEDGGTEVKLSEPVPVLEAGTGFLLIHRSVMEKFQETYPDFHYRPDHNRSEHFDGSRYIHAFFDTIIDNDKWLGEGNSQNTDRYLSEDYLFCQLSRKMGFKIWFCPWMQLRHIGSYIFEGHMGAIADIQGRQMYKKQHGVNPSHKKGKAEVQHGKAQFAGAPPPPPSKKNKREQANDVGEELFPLTPVPQWKKKEMEEAKKKKETDVAVASVGPKVVSGT